MNQYMKPINCKKETTVKLKATIGDMFMTIEMVQGNKTAEVVIRDFDENGQRLVAVDLEQYQMEDMANLLNHAAQEMGKVSA